MRLIPYILLAYVALGVQVGLGRFIVWNGAQPNLVLLAVIYIAANAPRDAALLGCFAMGALQDLMTQQPPGLFAVSYGLVAAVVGNARSTVYRRHPLTHVSLALLGGTVTEMVRFVHALIWSGGAGDHSVPVAVHVGFGTHVLVVLYTAALAPFVIGPLQRLRRAFSFQPPRRGMRA